MEQDFNDSYKKGEVLMQQALKKYAEGDVEGGDRDREEANRFFDLGKAETDADVGKMSALYGEGRNFGIIYRVLEGNTSRMIKSKKGRNALRKITGMIKEDRILKTQFDVYNALSCPNTLINDTDRYVNETVSLMPTMSESEIRTHNERLIETMQKYDIDELVNIDDDSMDVFESIEYMLTHRNSFSNVGEYSNAKGVVCENLMKRQKQMSESTEGNSASYEDELKRITEKYENILNDDEIELCNEINSCKEGKDRIFEKYKGETLDAIRCKIEENNANEQPSWKRIYENINMMGYNEESVLEDIAKMIEVKNTIG